MARRIWHIALQTNPPPNINGGGTSAPCVLSVSPNHGDDTGGTDVTIKGKHFTGASAVANLSSFVVVDDNTITGTTSAHAAGFATMGVTTSAGTGSRDRAFFFDATAGAPTLVTADFLQIDTAGGGLNVTFTGTNLGSASSFHIDPAGTNTPATIVSQTSTTITVTMPAHVSGVVTCRATGPGGSGDLVGAIEYWDPTQITGIDGYWDSNKGVTQASGLVSQWTDQANGIAATQSTGANKPMQTASVFGSLPSIRFAPQQWVAFAQRSGFTTGASFIFVGKWPNTDTATTSSNPTITPAYTAIGNDTGGVQNQFGASAGALEYHAHDGVSWQTITRGSGFNDNNQRLCVVTHDTSGNVKIYNATTQQGATATGITYSTAFENYATLGVGYTDADGWSGDIGAYIVVKGVISGGDLTKLNAWSRQRFGT